VSLSGGEIMKKLVVITAALGALVLLISLYCSAAPKGLSADTVREVFSTIKSSEGEGDLFAVDPATVTPAEGSFTRPGAAEAVVAFIDSNQPHVGLPGELWLLTYKGNWTPTLMIDQSDEVSFITADIAHNGSSEVLYTLKRWLTGGILLVRHTLVSLTGGRVKTIYNTDGTSYAFHEVWKQFGEKDPIIDHEIRLEDVNGDGVVELIDTELSGTFVHTGAGDDDGWEVRYTPVESTTYRFLIDTDKEILGVEKLPEAP
jgi:hypothetical protein